MPGEYVLVLSCLRSKLPLGGRLNKRCNLPVLPAIAEALQKEVADHMKEVEKGKTDHKIGIRIQMKVARAEEQEARKKWVKRQALQHS